MDRSRHRDGQRDNRAFEPMLEERSVHRPREKRNRIFSQGGKECLNSRVPGEEKERRRIKREEEEGKELEAGGVGRKKESRLSRHLGDRIYTTSLYSLQ